MNTISPKNHSFYIFNVFAESSWGGNPLAIVPLLDATVSMDTETMQRIARQFNLSETVFITPPTNSSDAVHAAHLRIFTPEHEMPFAGHPTIGAAAWLHQHCGLPEQFSLTTPAKTARITHTNGTYRFALSNYTHAPCALSRAQLAQGLGLTETDLGEHICWMNAGTWQLVIPLNSRAAVMRAQANTPLLRDASVDAARTNAYIWFEGNGEVTARYFFDINGAGIEDPGTGSACANLGAWAQLHGRMSANAPLNWHITQAEAIGRSNHLYLSVNADGEIQVGGRVMAFAQGELTVFQ